MAKWEENIERLTTIGDQRDAGRLAVLDTIRSSGEIARIDIANATGFSPATVTAISSELLQAGLVQEIIPESKPSQSKRGRPRVLIKLAGDAHLIAGVKVGQKLLSVLLMDFEGKEIASKEIAVDTPRMAPEIFVEQVLNAVSKTAEAAGKDIRSISGIGVSIAGLVDAKRGFIHWSSSLTERNVNLGALMKQHAPCPVFMDNDANLVAKAEHLFGVGRNIDNFIVITIEHGVGMGICIDGKIYRGARGCGAEFGHTKVQLEGALCQCGQRGCLEAYVGDYALLREAQGVMGEEAHKDVGSLFMAANDGDQIAISVLDRAAKMLALGLANVINIFDPQLIILAGAQMSYRHIFEDKIIEIAKKQVIQIDTEMPALRVHDWGDLMWAKGAAAFAIDEVSALHVRDLSAHVD